MPIERSDIPVPRLSKIAMREKLARPRKNRATRRLLPEHVDVADTGWNHHKVHRAGTRHDLVGEWTSPLRA